MKDGSLIDKMHALAIGTLSEEDEARLRERCAADAELMALLEQVLEVHAMTEPANDAPPPCRLTFEELWGASSTHWARRMVLRRPVRVAAAVLVLVVGSWLLSRAVSDRSDRSGGVEAGRALVLAALPPAKGTAPTAGPLVPELLADYTPVSEGRIRWIESFDTALAMGRASRRPVLLFIHHPTCPYCKQLLEKTLLSSDVLANLGPFVPALVNVMNQPEELRGLTRDGWPWLGVVDVEGNTILAFPGVRETNEYVASFLEATRLVPPSPLTWPQVNRTARILLDAKKAEDASDLGRAFRLFSIVRGAEEAGDFFEAAESGLLRIAHRALASLLGARELARSPNGPDAARAALDEAITLFADTPYAADLSRVRSELIRRGEFPEIQGLE